MVDNSLIVKIIENEVNKNYNDNKKIIKDLGLNLYNSAYNINIFERNEYMFDDLGYNNNEKLLLRIMIYRINHYGYGGSRYFNKLETYYLLACKYNNLTIIKYLGNTYNNINVNSLFKELMMDITKNNNIEILNYFMKKFKFKKNMLSYINFLENALRFENINIFKFIKKNIYFKIDGIYSYRYNKGINISTICGYGKLKSVKFINYLILSEFDVIKTKKIFREYYSHGIYNFIKSLNNIKLLKYLVLHFKKNDIKIQDYNSLLDLILDDKYKEIIKFLFSLKGINIALNKPTILSKITTACITRSYNTVYYLLSIKNNNLNIYDFHDNLYLINNVSKKEINALQNLNNMLYNRVNKKKLLEIYKV